MQHLRDTFRRPQPGIRTLFAHGQPGIGSGRGNVRLIQPDGDLPTTDALQRHCEDAPHNASRFFVNNDFVFLRRVHFVAIHGLAADELPLALLIPLHGLDLLGNVLGVHIIHNGTKRGNIVSGRLHTGINAIQQRDIAHPLFREVPLHVVPGHDIIPPQARQVFGDDHVDLLGLDVFEHPPKGRAVEAGAAEAIVDVGIENGQPMLLHKRFQQGLLVGNALGRAFAFILLG